ncbi:hypothetical protein ACHMW5_13675 [Azospirillum melinis]|uniref:hypothetical protein n=1 Tax=Azospirillum melinis TaxID=328839 RepID=UPI003757700A
MQDIIKAVDEIACKDEPLFRRVLASHDLGYADGYTQGKRHAYRRMTYALVPLAVVCGIVAWMIG